MSKKATVEYLKDAKVGDLVWYRDGNAVIYKKGKYMGRGVWRLCTVTKIGRKYFGIGLGNDQFTLQEFEIGTGYAKSVNGYAPPCRAFGQAEMMRVAVGPELKTAIEGQIKKTDDVALLKSLADMLGLYPDAHDKISDDED
jgi:hypothetical protein